LDAPRCPRAALTLVLFLATIVLGRSVLHAQQCSPTPDLRIQTLFQQQNWPEVARLAQSMPARNPDVNFAYGMALARLNRLAEARAVLLAGARQCPTQKRFPIEIAGVAFEQKQYPAAAHWLRRALRLDPHDAYANNFLATVYFLSGNLPAALQYWNRIQKPSVATLDLDPHLRIHRLLLDRAFAFSPAAVLREPQLLTTETRLNALGIFPGYNIHLAARPDGSFDAVFRAQEQNGFGSGRLAALLSTLGGLPYETIYPSYANINRAAMNFDALLRWDAQKRRAWASLSAPLNGFPQWRWEISTDLRNENWDVRRSFTGIAPVLGSLNLERESIDATLTSLHSGALQWSLGGELAHRNFRDVIPGSAFTPQLLTPGFEIKQLSTLNASLLRLPEHRFTFTAGARSDFARTLTTPSWLSEKLQVSARAHWLPQMQGDNYEVTQQLRAGKIFGTVPFDDFFVFGMDRDDTDLAMRAHLATRDGRKGSSPIGEAYFLSNTDFYRRIYGNGLIAIHVGPLLDIGKMSAPTSGLSNGQWLVDTGVEARLTVLHTSVVLSYGRDLRSGANAFFGTVAPPANLP
jgi:tetratricopeptide (TPR) repeat protein